MNWWDKLKGGVMVAAGSFIISNMIVIGTNSHDANYYNLPYLFDAIIGVLCLYAGILILFRSE